MVDLHPVTVQRIRLAVEASRAAGRVLPLQVDGDGDTSFIVWHDRTRHVIARGSERGMKQLLPTLEAEYARQRKDFAKESSAVKTGV